MVGQFTFCHEDKTLFYLSQWSGSVHHRGDKKLSRPNRVRWDTVQHIWLQPLQSQIVKALTFSCCPAGAQQQRSQQRSNPSGSSAPHRHVAEYNPACQGGDDSPSLVLPPAPILSSPLLLLVGCAPPAVEDALTPPALRQVMERETGGWAFYRTAAAAGPPPPSLLR